MILNKAELQKLQKRYGTDEAIGQVLKITRQRVHQLRGRYGIPSLRAKNEERNAKMRAMYKKGIKGEEIAKRFDMSISQTYRILDL